MLSCLRQTEYPLAVTEWDESWTMTADRTLEDCWSIRRRALAGNDKQTPDLRTWARSVFTAVSCCRSPSSIPSETARRRATNVGSSKECGGSSLFDGATVSVAGAWPRPLHPGSKIGFGAPVMQRLVRHLAMLVRHVLSNFVLGSTVAACAAQRDGTSC